MKTMRVKSVSACVFLLASSVFAQKVIQPWEVPCSEETVRPNLQLKEPHRFVGELKDHSGAPLAESKVVLRKLDTHRRFVEYRTVTTDKEGHFDLGTVEAGQYRFLPAPHRGFKQPKEVACWEGRDCEVKLVLLVNPSDQEFAGCPIQ
jgi:hypothetical protein